MDDNDKKVQHCYSCYDRMMFQLYGQSNAYDPGKQSAGYIKRYLDEGSPHITCDLCDRTVFYMWSDKEEAYLELERVKKTGESGADDGKQEARDTDPFMEKEV